jgi:hypothetical protein
MTPRPAFVNPAAETSDQLLTVVQEHKMHYSGSALMGSILNALYDHVEVPSGYRRVVIDAFGYDGSPALSLLSMDQSPPPMCCTICMEPGPGAYCTTTIANSIFTMAKQKLLKVPGFPDFSKANDCSI